MVGPPPGLELIIIGEPEVMLLAVVVEVVVLSMGYEVGPTIIFGGGGGGGGVGASRESIPKI